jgi:hypothetical protein
MSKFKVGDKVRKVKGAFSEDRLSGVVSGIHDSCLDVTLDRRHTELGASSYDSADKYELVESACSLPFKAGDKVRYKGGSWSDNGWNAGRVLTVYRCWVGSEGEIYVAPVEVRGNTYARHFELVEGAPESELERLVREANAGLAALETLRKHAGDVEITDDMSGTSTWSPLSPEHRVALPRVLRVKPKPSFEPFRVSIADDRNWLVCLDEGELCIGCQKFNAKEFVSAIRRSQDGSPDATLGVLSGHLMIGARKFVKWNDHKLSWEDADRILAALEKAGVK